MTPEEKIAAVKTAKIIRSTRKARGWTQQEAAKIIGVSQSALSKLENSALIPSVHQWFEFCTRANIPSDSHVHGIIDHLNPIQFQEIIPATPFKMKEEYRRNAGSSGRSVGPILNWLETRLGPQAYQEFLKEMGVDADYFVHLNYAVNFRFAVDLLQKMKDAKLLKLKDLETLTLNVLSRRNHGHLYQNYQEVTEPEALLNLIFSKSSYYDVNFKYEIDEVKDRKIVFSAKPEKHLLADSELKFSEASEFVCSYRGYYFKNLTRHLFDTPTEFKHLDCVYHGATRCTYVSSSMK